VFRCFPADYFSDWHAARRRQYIFILAVQMEIEIGDGTTRRFGLGDVVFTDDLTGQATRPARWEVPASVPLRQWVAYRGSGSEGTIALRGVQT